jgi:hypothetical protein
LSVQSLFEAAAPGTCHLTQESQLALAGARVLTLAKGHERARVEAARRRLLAAFDAA